MHLQEVFAIQDGNIFYRWVAQVRSWWSGVCYEEVFPIYGGPFQKDIHYEYLGSVGSGWSGAVCRKAVTIRGPKLTFVTKTCPTYNRDEILALQMGREKGIPQIVGYLGAILQGRSAVIFMELMAGGTLKQLVKKRMEDKKGPLLEETCLNFGKDIFEAQKFLHEKVGMAHNDIHEGNVLLNADHTLVKLTDFGSARVITKPEQLYNDTWKALCLLLFMLHGKRSHLYHEKVDEDGQYEGLDPKEDFPPQASQEMIELLTSIFGVGQKKLPSEAEILLLLNQKIKGSHIVDICTAMDTGVDREHLRSTAEMLPFARRFNEKKQGMHRVRKTSVVVTGLLGLLVLLILSYFYYYF
ncbi:PREDICTED: dual specificity mitogen-activated protein kinase kinase 1-like isoform X3 [Acropora digitifera]|uniref:dual specificity mitogen-activated protein kinase kinase 1-like isoform X3 n=1 Tax=Acropora digitifera TaxID=70779 RepID=UPI00077A1121|nr:PREDICTED: dual specificity mitogen-activated protein kinase kinase 1-like isoform X3 [Acropora digitifera]